jgi:uncharacterized protein YjlB
MRYTSHPFADDGDIPNNRLPVIVYARVIDPLDGSPEEAFEELFGGNGWGGMWTDGIYDFHHYHSTAHEVLGIARGSADVRFGGRAGETLTLRAGDAVLIPAGVGHKRESASRDLVVIGAYPAGQSPDLIREGAPNHGEVRARIGNVGCPETDPVQGEGAMQRLWRGAKA